MFVLLFCLCLYCCFGYVCTVVLVMFVLLFWLCLYCCFGYVCTVVLSRLRILFKASCQLRHTLVLIVVVTTK